jgi:hypothetical protein
MILIIENTIRFAYRALKSRKIIVIIIATVIIKGPNPELYTKYTVMWRNPFTARNISKMKVKKMIRAVFLFLFTTSSPFHKQKTSSSII